VGIEWVPERSREGVFAASGTRPVVYRANGTGLVIKVGMRTRRSYMATALSPADLKLGLARRGKHLHKTEVETPRKALVVLRELVRQRVSLRSWLGEILTRANLYRRPSRGTDLSTRLCAKVAEFKTVGQAGCADDVARAGQDLRRYALVQIPRHLGCFGERTQCGIGAASEASM
jgi:hypothetical protein